jgi:LAO/AO transport system kinase
VWARHSNGIGEWLAGLACWAWLIMETPFQVGNDTGSTGVVPGGNRPKGPSVDDYVEGVRRGDRAMLGRAITLVESTSSAHETMAQEVLQRLLPATGKARRVGITGVPGVGKSTFIEALGMHLCSQGLRVAVLAVDPTSSRSRGSILGDKTRMEKLSGEPKAFIRPSPSGGSLGGLARRTRETLLLCEAAGYNAILVETVGVGQSETAVRDLVDFFLLLLLPGSGDDLQGIKRGIMEMADAAFVNKADGDNRLKAEAMRSEQAMALHYLTSPTPGWHPEVRLGSALTGEGIPAVWTMVERFYAELEPRGMIQARRRDQEVHWLDDLLRDVLERRFRRHAGVQELRPLLEGSLARGELTVVQAARRLLEVFDGIAPMASPTQTAPLVRAVDASSTSSFSNPLQPGSTPTC